MGRYVRVRSAATWSKYTASRSIAASSAARAPLTQVMGDGFSRGFLARLETARHDPKLSTLEKIAKALKVDIAKLLN